MIHYSEIKADSGHKCQKIKYDSGKGTIKSDKKKCKDGYMKIICSGERKSCST